MKLHPMPQSLGAGWEDVVHEPPRERIAVLNGLSSVDGPPSIPELLRPGPTGQSDYYMALGCLNRAAQQDCSHYLGQRRRPPQVPRRYKHGRNSGFWTCARPHPSHPLGRGDGMGGFTQRYGASPTQWWRHGALFRGVNVSYNIWVDRCGRS